MLLSFAVENFLSFQDQVELNLQAGGIKELDHNIVLRKNIRVLKSAGLYGANASGKSNFLKAFSFVRRMILHSPNESHSFENVKIEPFKLTSKNEKEPSSFKVVFMVSDDIFDYRFSLTSKKILTESLLLVKGKNAEVIFSRSEDIFVFHKQLLRNTDLRGQLKTLTGITRNNVLFISILSQFNIEFGKNVCNWFSKTSIVFDANNEEIINYTAALLTNKEYYQLINQVISNTDLGFTQVLSQSSLTNPNKISSYQFISSLIVDMSKQYDVFTIHKKFSEERHIENVQFNLMHNESLGTQKFFGLLGPILESLKRGSTIFIDEIDSRFHTLLLISILKLFNSEINNPNGAQLIFTSHNTAPLKDILRRDQMLFIQKNEIGASFFESLYSNKPFIRKDASFEKDYLAGEFGAIPKIGNQLNLFNDQHDL